LRAIARVDEERLPKRKKKSGLIAGLRKVHRSLCKRTIPRCSERAKERKEVSPMTAKEKIKEVLLSLKKNGKPPHQSTRREEKGGNLIAFVVKKTDDARVSARKHSIKSCRRYQERDRQGDLRCGVEKSSILPRCGPYKEKTSCRRRYGQHRDAPLGRKKTGPRPACWSETDTKNSIR